MTQAEARALRVGDRVHRTDLSFPGKVNGVVTREYIQGSESHRFRVLVKIDHWKLVWISNQNKHFWEKRA